MAVATSVKVLVHQYDVSRWLKGIKPNYQVDEKESTNFASGGAREFKAGLTGAAMSSEGFYERTAGGTDVESDGILHGALGNSTERVVTVGLLGLAVGARVHMFSMNESKYEIATDMGELSMVTADLTASGEPMGGVSLNPLTTNISAGGNAASVDHGAATAKGGVGHIHVPVISGTTPSITGKIQHSVDNSTWVDLITFTAIATNPGAERIALATNVTVNRYVRALWTVGGTGLSINAAVAFARRL